MLWSNKIIVVSNHNRVIKALSEGAAAVAWMWMDVIHHIFSSYMKEGGNELPMYNYTRNAHPDRYVRTYMGLYLCMYAYACMYGMTCNRVGVKSVIHPSLSFSLACVDTFIQSAFESGWSEMFSWLIITTNACHAHLLPPSPSPSPSTQIHQSRSITLLY